MARRWAWLLVSAPLVGACGGESGANSPPDFTGAMSEPTQSEAGAPTGDRDVKPDSLSDAAAVAPASDASDAHAGPWLPLTAPDGAVMAQMAQMACLSVFTSLPRDCGAHSPLSQAPMGYVDLCAYAQQDAALYCEGVTDPKPATECVSACWQGRSTTALADALCVFRCYDAAICGADSSAALTKCDASSSDAIGCLITGSCYPSFDPSPW